MAVFYSSLYVGNAFFLIIWQYATLCPFNKLTTLSFWSKTPIINAQFAPIRSLWKVPYALDVEMIYLKISPHLTSNHRNCTIRTLRIKRQPGILTALRKSLIAKHPHLQIFPTKAAIRNIHGRFHLEMMKMSFFVPSAKQSFCERARLEENGGIP